MLICGTIIRRYKSCEIYSTLWANYSVYDTCCVFVKKIMEHAVFSSVNFTSICKFTSFLDNIRLSFFLDRLFLANTQKKFSISFWKCFFYSRVGNKYKLLLKLYSYPMNTLNSSPIAIHKIFPHDASLKKIYTSITPDQVNPIVTKNGILIMFQTFSIKWSENCIEIYLKNLHANKFIQKMTLKFNKNGRTFNFYTALKKPCNKNGRSFELDTLKVKHLKCNFTKML